MSKPPKGPKHTITLQLPWDLLQAVDAKAERLGRSRQGHIAIVLRADVEAEDGSYTTAAPQKAS